MSNPYEPPTAVGAVPESYDAVGPRRLDWLCWLLATVPLQSVYFSWLVAWISLGHQPRPNLDDPKYINLAVSTAVVISGLFLVSIPALAIGLPTLQIASAGRSHAARIVYAAVTFSILAGIVMMFRWDPLDVIEWLMD